MRDFSRTDRIADQMQKELALLIQREVKDPRLNAMVTVSGVKVSKDLGYADVYVTFLGLEDAAEAIQENLAILRHAAGYLRTRLGQSIKLRSLPQLRFHYDASVVRGRALSSLIEQAVEEDRQRHQDD